MKYEIVWNDSAIDYLNKTEHFVKNRIVKKIERLAENFSYHNLKRLENSKFYRLRIGDYRVILDIKKEIKILKVLRIGHRRNIYKI